MLDSVNEVRALKEEFIKDLQEGRQTPWQLLKDERFKNLSQSIGQLPSAERQSFGRALNELKDFLLQSAEKATQESKVQIDYLDVTAPFDLNSHQPPNLLPAENGSIHPLLQTQAELVTLFNKMGFTALESRQLDSEFYMFDSLNFPAQHPARDEFDTFLLAEKDPQGNSLVAPAHTSTMQNRVLKAGRPQLEEGRPIAVVIPGRVFRSEDVDASHDHMFYQLEGVYVDKKVTVAGLIATLKEAMSIYFGQKLSLKIQPFYFPFTEPSFEFAISCPFCSQHDRGCRVCNAGWIELLGCGMIHPNVLSLAGIDPLIYTGFAWGLGINRLVMIKNGIEDIRHFYQWGV